MRLMVSMMLAILQLPTHAQGKERLAKHQTIYRTIKVDGRSIVYREAGPKNALTLALVRLPGECLLPEAS